MERKIERERNRRREFVNRSIAAVNDRVAELEEEQARAEEERRKAELEEKKRKFEEEAAKQVRQQFGRGWVRGGPGQMWGEGAELELEAAIECAGTDSRVQHFHNVGRVCYFSAQVAERPLSCYRCSTKPVLHRVGSLDYSIVARARHCSASQCQRCCQAAH
jgi:hypothetical protein